MLGAGAGKCFFAGNPGRHLGDGDRVGVEVQYIMDELRSSQTDHRVALANAARVKADKGEMVGQLGRKVEAGAFRYCTPEPPGPPGLMTISPNTGASVAGRSIRASLRLPAEGWL